jgi:hypothetical protein
MNLLLRKKKGTIFPIEEGPSGYVFFRVVLYVRPKA